MTYEATLDRDRSRTETVDSNLDNHCIYASISYKGSVDKAKEFIELIEKKREKRKEKSDIKYENVGKGESEGYGGARDRARRRLARISIR